MVHTGTVRIETDRLILRRITIDGHNIRGRFLFEDVKA